MSCMIYIESELGQDDGFYLTNSIGESIRDYIMKRASRLQPEVHSVLTETELAQEWWPGLDLDLGILIRAAQGRAMALELAMIDEAFLDEVADNPTWRANLIQALELTTQLLKGELKGIHYPKTTLDA